MAVVACREQGRAFPGSQRDGQVPRHEACWEVGWAEHWGPGRRKWGPLPPSAPPSSHFLPLSHARPLPAPDRGSGLNPACQLAPATGTTPPLPLL